jgi:RNA polymerase sigma-70 factor (ECF subfamily)
LKDSEFRGHVEGVAGIEPDPVLAGRASRFEAMFGETYPRVFAYALRRTGNRHAAEEVASETYLVAWRRFDAMPDERLPWLLGTARKVLANHRRSAKRRSPDGPRASLEMVEAPDPGTPIPELIAEREAFAAAFGALGHRDREVLALVAWDGLRPREAARVMGCTAATFSLRLHRARRRLLKELDSRGHLLGEAGNRTQLKPRPGATEAR